MTEAVPEETTFWRFGSRLQETGILQEGFAALQGQLQAHELVLEKGTLIDASIKPAASRPPRTDRETGETHPSRDADATFVKKRGQTTFGYKVHVGVVRRGGWNPTSSRR